MNQNAVSAAKNAYDIEIECLREMKEVFDEEAYAKAVDLLIRAPRIGTCGCGHSGIVCQHYAHLLCCIEQPARFISSSSASSCAASMLI